MTALMDKLKRSYESEPGSFSVYDDEPAFNDYGPLIRTFGEVLAQEEEGWYSGDSIALLKDESGRFGVLVFGWGSCSGCDALYACHNWKALHDLAEKMAGGIRWGNRDEIMRYIREHDWRGDFIDDELADKFRASSIAALDPTAARPG